MKQPVDTRGAKVPLSFAFLLPILTMLITAAIVIAGGVRPYEKLQTYLKIAFMDDLKQAPADRNSGLTITASEIKTVEEDVTTYTEGTPEYPTYGTQFAVLSCEPISLYVPVYWGSNAKILEEGAGQATTSALPGAGGNSVISAHVNTFFADLSQMEIGDSVVIYTNYGKFTYEVAEEISFENTNKQYIVPTEDERLTLYTCEMQVFGSSTKRVGVICKPVLKEFYEPLNADTPVVEHDAKPLSIDVEDTTAADTDAEAQETTAVSTEAAASTEVTETEATATTATETTKKEAAAQ